MLVGFFLQVVYLRLPRFTPVSHCSVWQECGKKVFATFAWIKFYPLDYMEKILELFLICGIVVMSAVAGALVNVPNVKVGAASGVPSGEGVDGGS